MFKKPDFYYHALIRRDPAFDGVFYVGVTTTRVFCRPTCPARKPKRENCEFFATAQQAILASFRPCTFRPCKRCHPLSHPGETSRIIQSLMEAVDREPHKRWRGEDLAGLNIDPSTARRQFKARFGMTFVEFARARRLGLAFEQIRAGDSVVNAQIDAGYESGSGFRDAFSKIMGAPPRARTNAVLSAAWIDTPLGPMLAIADESALHLLEYVDRRGLEREIERLRRRSASAIVPGGNTAITQIEKELKEYFAGELKNFATPISQAGSPFQKSVWELVARIPAGRTRSYAEIASAVGRPAAVRAVGQANGANQLAIIIPCHRVVASNGGLAGYGGGLARKKWLLEHERELFTDESGGSACGGK